MRDSCFRSCPAHRTAQRVVLASVILVAGAAATLAQGRAPVPDDAAQAEARQLIREIYGPQCDEARTSAEKTALARKMLDQAAKIKGDVVSHFALLRVARDIAIQAGDTDTALEAVDQISRTYQVDSTAMKVETLLQTAANARLSEQRKAAVQAAIPLIRAAVEDDDYKTANGLVRKALDLARRLRDGELLKQMVATKREVAQSRQGYAEVQKAQAVLEDKPTDPEANLAVGRYLCLVKGDWEKGIPLLAWSSDAELKALAARELEGTKSVDEEVALGDGWWEVARARNGTEKESLMLRAGSLYRQAQPKLSGLVKVKVENRLKEIAGLGRPPPEKMSRASQSETIAGGWGGARIQLRRTLEDHKEPVVSLAFLPDGSMLASGACGPTEMTLRLWEPATGKLHRTFEGVGACLAVSPDGSTLAAADWNRAIRLCDVTTGEIRRTLEGHDKKWITSVAFSPDGSLLASSGHDQTVRLWNVANGELLRNLHGHTDVVNATVFPFDGTLVVSGAKDATVKFWDVASGELRKTLLGHNAVVTSIAISRDGAVLASGGDGGEVRLLDVRSREHQRTLKVGSGFVGAAAFSADGSVLAAASDDNSKITLWEVATGEHLQEIIGHSQPVRALTFSPDGSILASGSADKSVKLWGPGTSEKKTSEASPAEARKPAEAMAMPTTGRAFGLALTVDGIQRSALVYPGIRARMVPSPVLFFFHGFAGRSKGEAQSKRFQELWPEATVVYPQGLSDVVSGGGKMAAGWRDARHAPRHVDNREIRFVDRLLEELSARWRVDPRRIYATGYSNGGFVTFLLLLERPDVFAAFAPVASYGLCVSEARTPRPVMYVFGERDDCFDHDKPGIDGSEMAKQTLLGLLKLNRCDYDNKTQLPGGLRMFGPEAGGEPVVWHLHEGGHSWPEGVSELIVRFFQEHSLGEGE